MRVEDRILKTVVFIGKEAGGQFTPLGTAFVGVVQEGTASIPLLVTAAHVIDDYFKETDTIFVRLNRNSGGVGTLSIVNHGFRHSDKGTDLAILPLPVDPGMPPSSPSFFFGCVKSTLLGHSAFALGMAPLPHMEGLLQASAWYDGSISTAWSRRFDMEEREIRAALDRHWAASDANDLEGEHQIYREDAVLEYPQSGERIRGRRQIQSSRAAQPNRKRFTVRRIVGAGDLWVTEYVLTYDGRPSYTVSIMEFLDGKVARETQYFGDPFEPGPSRAQWVERMP